MRQAHLLVSMLWCIHGSLLFNAFESEQDSTSFEDLLEYPEGMDLNDVQEWFIEFDADIPQYFTEAFCVPLDVSECTTWTRGASTKMVRFYGRIVALRQACIP